ncbi:Hypothetical predicted protein, partial [Paramuricea clavata]
RQKEATESAENIETLLAKRRETWQERTAEAKGKKKEYDRQYYYDKMQNMTEDERTNRLQRRKEDRASKTVDERAKILKILRATFNTSIASENDQERKDRLAEERKERDEANEQLSMSVDPTVSVDISHSVSEVDEKTGSVHEAEPEGVSRNEYLHEGGCQNVDNPLHELEFVQNEMHSFHLDQEHLEHRQCTMCKEAWPTRQNLASEVYICYRCKRDKKSPKKFSAENDMDPGTVPEQLRDIQSFLNRLPSRMANLPVLIVRKHGAEDTHQDFTVRRHKVLEAVLWLKTNNPFFKNIEIDRDVIQSLPENGIPDEL